MKIRSDFVTNSSSSSFVVAKKNESTYDDIYSFFKNNIKKIKDEIEENGEYFNISDEIMIEIENGKFPEEQVLNCLVEEFLNEFTGYKKPLSIGGWEVISASYGNEEGELLSNIIYSCNLKTNDENDVIKLKSFS